MQLYPQDAALKLGFHAIRQALAGYCFTEAGRAWAQQLLPIAHTEQLAYELDLAEEARNLLAVESAPPTRELPPVQPLFEKAGVVGAHLLLPEVERLEAWLTLVAELKTYLLNRAERYPLLAGYFKAGTLELSLLKELRAILGPDGALRTDASTELGALLRAEQATERNLRKELEATLRQANSSGHTAAGELALRGEVLTLPLKVEHKAKVQGIVVDVSQTGQTVFVQPLSALAYQNELREIRARIGHEVVRILTAFTDRVREQLPSLQVADGFLLAFDKLLAKARLAIALDAQRPKLTTGEPTATWHLMEARHPLLLMQKGAKQVVPLTMQLVPPARMLLISGPNAGGKSVALKTAGLLQLMLQAGLLVPADARSTFPLFQRLMVDIGDDQSLQDDLSTYSSHLLHMRHVLEELDANSLLLIDEFGSGTDPQLGGPLAEAMLDAFVQREAWGVITTHYSNLKEYGGASAFISPAAMRFDTKRLAPTYILEQGHPGSSYAYEMARRVGLPDDLITHAKQLGGQLRAETEETLEALRNERAELQARLRQLDEKDSQLQQLLEQYRALKAKTEEERRRLAKEARQDAELLLKQANKRIEATIRAIREAEAEKERTKALRKELEQEVLKPFKEPAPPKQPKRKPKAQPPAELEIGATVRLKESGMRGEIIGQQGELWLIALGQLQLKVPADELEPLAPPKKREARSNVAKARQGAETLHELDVRGERVEAAIPKLERFIDQAILSGVGRLRVVHGKGSGALRKALRRHVQQNFPQVQAIEDVPEEHGGTGVSILVL